MIPPNVELEIVEDGPGNYTLREKTTGRQVCDIIKHYKSPAPDAEIDIAAALAWARLFAAAPKMRGLLERCRGQLKRLEWVRTARSPGICPECFAPHAGGMKHAAGCELAALLTALGPQPAEKGGPATICCLSKQPEVPYASIDPEPDKKG